MRMLQINKREFQYRNALSDAVPIRDENGHLTGEYMQAYTDKFTAYANISPASGIAAETYFGSNLDYDRIIASDTDFGMDEQSQLWVDDLNSERHDYVVKRIARSINNVLIAISKVTNNANN